MRTKQQNSLKEMQVSLNNEIAQKTQQEVFAISRKALAIWLLLVWKNRLLTTLLCS